MIWILFPETEPCGDHVFWILLPGFQGITYFNSYFFLKAKLGFLKSQKRTCSIPIFCLSHSLNIIDASIRGNKSCDNSIFPPSLEFKLENVDFKDSLKQILFVDRLDRDWNWKWFSRFSLYLWLGGLSYYQIMMSSHILYQSLMPISWRLI